MSVEKWLALPDDKLAIELGRAFTPEEVCKHDWVDLILRMPGLCNLKYKCTRCALHVAEKTEFGCVPNPIKLDWKTAMYWFRQYNPSRTILRQVCGPEPIDCVSWFLVSAQPKHYLIAAATAVEGARHETM